MTDSHDHDHDQTHDVHEDHAHHGPTSFWTKYVFSTDHKVIGIQFMFSSMLFVLLGGLLALGVRYQIAWPQQNVPYAKLLPAGTGVDDTGATKMTAQVDEPNLALWKIGGTVVLTSDVDIDGQKFPEGAKAKLIAMPDGLAVAVPAGTRITENGETRDLAEPIDGFVSAKRVIGDYDYTALVPRARTSAGAVVTVPANESEGQRTLTLKGVNIPRPGGDIDFERNKILLPIRVEATMVKLEVAKQTVTIDAADRLEAFDLTESQKTSLADKLAAIVAANDQKQQKVQELAVDDPVESARVERLIKDAQIEAPVKAGAIESLSANYVAFRKQQLTTDAYLSLFTMHASIMIFFVVIPSLVGGFGNFLIPLMIGARDMAFPKINMLSFWISVPVGMLMIASFWVPNGAAGGGWTMYPPLSATPGAVNSVMGTHIWVVGVALVGFVSILGSINYVTTIINMRAPGMSMFRMPLTIWALFITAILQVFATPVLTAAMILLFFDRVLGAHFFGPFTETMVDGVMQLQATGGQPLMFQHLFWFYSHPAVYIMILPAMGIVSDVLATNARKPIFGYRPMVFAISAIAGLGFIVWGHHMFQSGMNPVLGTTFMASTIMIAVPSAIKVFNWLGTLWGGDIRFTPAMLNAIAFVSMFTIGGLSGIFMASTPVDIHIHDTYFIVAHIHYVLFGGSIFGIFAGLYHWYPKMFGREMNYKWGVIHFIMTVIAFNGTFFLMHILGVSGMPRRYASFMEVPTLHHLQEGNVMMTMWAMSLGMAQLPFFYNFFVSLPRRLGRGMVATFLTVLIGSTVMGITYWTGTQWQVIEGVSLGATDKGEQLRDVVGYIACVGGLFLLLVGLWRGLPRGGKIASAIILLPLMVLMLLVAKWAMSGALTAPLLQEFHNIIVALGFGIIAGMIVSAIVFTVWGIGGALQLPALLQRVMYVVFLPAFLAPLVIKPDMFIIHGIAGLHDYRWFILILLALPGLLYWLAVRPRDTFGAPAPQNPWHGNSLEWVAESPPIHLNFDTIPTVYRGPYEYSSPVVEQDHLPQDHRLPPGVVEPAGH